MRRLPQWILCVVSLFAVSMVAASELNEAVLRLMREPAAGLERVQLLHRAAVHAELEVVVALGYPRTWRGGIGEGSQGWWDKQTKLGLFLQRRDQPGLVYRITNESGEGDGDCSARVERATSTDVVVSCTPEKGRMGPNHKFVYDIRAKGLVRHLRYQPFAINRILVSDGEAVLYGSTQRYGSSPQRSAVIEYVPGREPLFRVLRSTLEAESREPHPANEQSGTVKFGPNGRFQLFAHGETNSLAGRYLVVRERTNAGVKLYPLPQSTYEEFSRLRHRRVTDGYSREGTEISEQIGPVQIFENTLWFGKTFYDGEGHTGAGGFGYFDAEKREYRLWSPDEVRDWSVTALLVETDAVWLGLAGRGEWGDSGGGLLRFDRATDKAERFALREIASSIARVGEGLIVATELGVATIDGRGMRRFIVDEMTDGRLRLAETLPAEPLIQRAEN